MQEECAPALRQLAGRRSANIGDADLADFRQSEVTQSIVKSEVEATLARADIPEMSRAAIRSAGGKGAGSWLCPPCQPEHYFTNRQFQVSLCCRMDLDIPGHSGTCKHTKPDGSICGAILDSKGRHARACRNQGWRVRKHNAVAAGLADWCAAHGCVVETESVVPTASDASEESRMDLILRAPNHAQPIYVDVTVADATSVEALSRNAANRDGAAAQVLEDRKRKKYPNIKVMPFAIESHGRLGQSAMSLIKLVAPKRAAERAEAIADVYQKISALFQRTQADAIMTATGSRNN